MLVFGAAWPHAAELWKLWASGVSGLSGFNLGDAVGRQPSRRKAGENFFFGQLGPQEGFLPWRWPMNQFIGCYRKRAQARWAGRRELSLLGRPGFTMGRGDAGAGGKQGAGQVSSPP